MFLSNPSVSLTWSRHWRRPASGHNVPRLVAHPEMKPAWAGCGRGGEVLTVTQANVSFSGGCPPLRANKQGAEVCSLLPGGPSCCWLLEKTGEVGRNRTNVLLQNIVS